MDWGSFPWTWTLRGYLPEREGAPGAVNGVFRTSSNAVECAFGLLPTFLDSFQCCQMWSMGASRTAVCLPCRFDSFLGQTWADLGWPAEHTDWGT